jgi:hypothetical protein
MDNQPKPKKLTAKEIEAIVKEKQIKAQQTICK